MRYKTRNNYVIYSNGNGKSETLYFPSTYTSLKRNVYVFPENNSPFYQNMIDTNNTEHPFFFKS